MKPLIILFMAFAATNAFFLSDKARQEFYQEMERIFSNSHKFIVNGDVRIPLEPIKMFELTSALEKFHALSEEERGALKNYLFGVRFPRPLPASHMTDHHPYDEEKLKEIHAKWESMTPEEREEVRIHRRKDHEHIKPDFIHRFPRDMPEHHLSEDCDHFDEQKMEELREKLEAMTPEDRAELKASFRKDHAEVRSHSGRSFQAIRPLPEFFPNDIPNTRPMVRPGVIIGRPVDWDSPFQKPEKPIADWIVHQNNLPEYDQVLHPIDGNFQAIKPLQEMDRPVVHPGDIIGRPVDWNSHFPKPERPIARPQDDIGRPADWRNHRPFPKPEKPIADWIARPNTLPEYDQVLYPIDGNFQPIKPLQELEIQQASDNGRTRPVDPVARDRMPQPIQPIPIRKASNDVFDDMTDEERLQVIRELFPEGLPIRPIGPIPIIPADKDGAFVFEHEDVANAESRNIEDYPHRSRRPRSFQPILPLQRQPILPIKSQPILPLQRQPILPMKSQPILPMKTQSIFPEQFQPIMPF